MSRADGAKSQKNVILLIVLMTGVLAVGSVLMLAYVQNRPKPDASATVASESEAGSIPLTSSIVVDGVSLTVNSDPNNMVDLVNTFDVQPLSTDATIPPAGDLTIPTPEGSVVTELPTVDPNTIVQVQVLTPAPVTDLGGQIPQPVVTAVPVIFQPYTVQPGDTLYSITQRLDTSIALLSEYGISQDDVQPGTIINMPVGNPEYCPGRRPYAVGEGDTAFNVAHRLNTTPEELKAINNLGDDYVLYLATIICVP